MGSGLWVVGTAPLRWFSAPPPTTSNPPPTPLLQTPASNPTLHAPALVRPAPGSRYRSRPGLRLLRPRPLPEPGAPSGYAPGLSHRLSADDVSPAAAGIRPHDRGGIRSGPDRGDRTLGGREGDAAPVHFVAREHRAAGSDPGRSGETGRPAEDDGRGGGGDRPAHAGHRAADSLGTRQRTSRVRNLDADGLPASGFRRAGDPDHSQELCGA